jgi:cobalt-zinc-cadmium efflux system membrane fusion protein
MVLVDVLFHRIDADPATEVSQGNDEESNHDDEQVVDLSPAEMEEFGITVAKAGPGNLTIHKDLPGEIVVDPERLAHMIPRFPGTVLEVRKRIGDAVKQGDVLAVIESNESLTPFEIRSSLSGTVIEMHLSPGEMVSDGGHAILVADLSEVWANLSIYQKDLPYINTGQSVEIEAGPGIPPIIATISYVAPVVDEVTRTAIARAVLPNLDGRWRPGLFVTGRIIIDTAKAGILIPKTALQTIAQQAVVFIKTDHGFKPQPVMIGRTNETSVEVLSGILTDDIYVSKGGFTLKAELQKESVGAGHGH